LNDRVVIEKLNYDVLSPDNLDLFLHMVRQGEDNYVVKTPSIQLPPPNETTEMFPEFETVPREVTIGPPESCYVIPFEVLRYDVDFNPSTFNRAFQDLMNNIAYLGPLRHFPERTYLWTGTAPKEMGPRGENTIAMLIASERNRTERRRRGPSLARREPPLDLLKQVSDWLNRMNLVNEFQIASIGTDKRFYEAKVSVGVEGIGNSLIDVGFGVSQVLPVVTLLLSAPEGSIVLIEQPEIHLHPSAQAHLADLFLEVAEQRGLQLIIESHSEHLLARLQRRIAETEYAFANPDNIKMYFCRAEAHGSSIQPVEINEYGQIANWPENFFGDMAGDVDAMMDAAIERRRRELSLGD
jgi:hypothetical protein